MLGNASPSGAGGAGGGGGGGGKGWGWGRREVGTGDTIFLGSTGGTESLAMLPMVAVAVVAISIDNDKVPIGSSRRPNNIGGMLAAPQLLCPGDTCLVGQIGPTSAFVPRLRRDIFLFSRRKNVIFDYNEYDILLNGHRRFPQKGGI